MADKQYELGYGHFGNGLTVWNRLEERDGDYIKVAHIDTDRSVTFYDNDLPENILAEIEQLAQTSNAVISATQDMPVFSVPAEPIAADKRMVQDYEVKNAIHIGGKEVVFAENLASKDPYMVCECQWANPFGIEIYSHAVVGADYLEAMTVYLGRVSAEVEKIQQERTERGISGEPLTANDCIPGSHLTNYEGQLVVIRPEKMVASARTPDAQLLIATGGNGCNPEARGSAIFCKNLFSGKAVRWERTDVAGIIAPDKIPAWAQRKLKEMGITVVPSDHPKVYMDSLAQAREKNEIPLFHESQRLNEECARGIEKAIQDCYTGDFHYDLAAALDAVFAQFGMERLQIVLANTLERMSWDGRFSATNKQWSRSIELPDHTDHHRTAYVCNTHPAVLDGFVNRMRKAQMEKEKTPSITDQLKKADKTPPRKPQKKSREEGR